MEEALHALTLKHNSLSATVESFERRAVDGEERALSAESAAAQKFDSLSVAASERVTALLAAEAQAVERAVTAEASLKSALDASTAAGAREEAAMQRAQESLDLCARTREALVSAQSAMALESGRLRESLEASRAAFSEKEDKCEALESRCEDLQAALDKVTRVAQMQAQSVLDAQSERELQLAGQLESMRQALVETERGAGEALHRSAVAEEEAGELRIRVEKLTGALDHVSSLMEATLAEKDALERRCKELGEEVESIAAELAEVQDRLREATEAMEEAREEARFAHAALEDRTRNNF